MRPGPTARIVPSWGFSLAVSGITMPLLVISSPGVGWMTTRSPSGRSFFVIDVATARLVDFEAWTGLALVAVAKGWFLLKVVLR